MGKGNRDIVMHPYIIHINCTYIPEKHNNCGHIYCRRCNFSIKPTDETIVRYDLECRKCGYVRRLERKFHTKEEVVCFVDDNNDWEFV